MSGGSETKRRSATRGQELQSAVSYAILLTLLVIVVFPFYWMTITSFKSEDADAEPGLDVLAEPVRHRELRAPPRQDRVRGLVRQQRHRVGEQHAPGHRHRHHRRLRAGPAPLPRAARSWRAPC